MAARAFYFLLCYKVWLARLKCKRLTEVCGDNIEEEQMVNSTNATSIKYETFHL
jgi:hypothetical protein